MVKNKGINDSGNYIKIRLDDKHAILSDERQWILGIKSKHYNANNSKSSEYNHIGFYSNMENLIVGYIDLVARKSNSKTIQELQDFTIKRCKALQEVTPIKIIVGGEKE